MVVIPHSVSLSAAARVTVLATGRRPDVPVARVLSTAPDPRYYRVTCYPAVPVSD